MNHRQTGFTLLEMVVALGIIALLSVVLSQVFITTLRTNTKTEVIKDMKQNGEVTLETVVRAIQNAKSITCTSAQSITVENADATTATYECQAAGSQTRFAKVTAYQTTYLTSENTTLGGTDCASSSLSMTCSDINGSPASVTISFSLAQNGTSTNAFENSSASFQTSVIMRNLQ